MTLREALKELAPPLLVRSMRTALGRGLRFEGDFATWADAQQAAEGYDRGEIVRRVLEAELKVKKGEAADARDGVTFGEIQFSLPVMAALARVSAMRGGALHVLDFGGALGGLHRQYKAFVPGGNAAWTVVEQQSYVDAGKEHFQNGELRFVASLDEALAGEPTDVALFSSVLQYLPEPYEAIRRIVAAGVLHVVIDRTPSSHLDHDLLAVQRVPPEIYPASYPCWIFSRKRLRDAFAPAYTVLSTFTDGSGEWRSAAARFELAGFILDRQR
jgi:putative methyltransferase (TIGR04325 family)